MAAGSDAEGSQALGSAPDTVAAGCCGCVDTAEVEGGASDDPRVTEVTGAGLQGRVGAPGLGARAGVNPPELDSDGAPDIWLTTGAAVT